MRTINLNKEFYSYLSNEIRTNNNLNDVDKTIASYLMYLEQTRISRNENENDYIYPSYDAITKATNVKARQTIVKSINKLVGMGIILKLVKGSVKDGANRYWMNQNYINHDMITEPSTKTPVIEYRSIENPETNQIMVMLKEIQSEVKALRKENQDLKNEIREMKEMMLESQAMDDNEIMEIEEPQVDLAVETPSMPENIEYRSIVPIQPKEENNGISEKAESIFNRLRPKMPIVEDDYDRELDDVLDKLANGKDEPVIEPVEEATVVKPSSVDEIIKSVDEKYKNFSYIYEKPFSKLHTEKELRNEIDFRIQCNKPLYDLKERLAEIKGIA